MHVAARASIAVSIRGGVVQIFELRPLEERQALALVECPVCEAKAGDPCFSKLGNVRKPHALRWEVSP